MLYASLWSGFNPFCEDMGHIAVFSLDLLTSKMLEQLDGRTDEM